MAPPCDLLLPLSSNLIGWSMGPAFEVFAVVDYADGLLGGSLGRTAAGRINERPLDDGRREVAVTLHTKNALAWVSDISTDFSSRAV